jgi:hypothetical protein
MSKRENDKVKAEQRSQINLEDLPVDEARQDEVKGGESEEPDTKYRLVILAAKR